MFEDSVSFIPSIWASMNSWFTPTVLFVLLNLMIGTIAITSSLTSSTSTQKHHGQSGEQHTHPHLQLARSPSMLQRLKSINFYSYRSQEPTTHFQEPHHEMEPNFALRQPQEQVVEQPSHSMTRSPSMLQKLKSNNLYHYISHEYFALSHQAQPTSQIQTHPEPEPEPEQTHLDFEPEEEKEEGEEESRDQFEDEDHSQSLDEIYSQLKSDNGHVARSKSDTKPTSGEAPAKLSRKMKKSASAKSAFAHLEEADVVESRRPATVREGKARVTEVDDEEVDAKADDFINKFRQGLKLQRLDSIKRDKEMIGRGAGK
ncbi:hypothetical protein PanWU01x14_181920 [Parasponia andersonii]|uniref:DUF4408 domain-containing protein n=1 Tax=Parasponia andersonii TaxID=3476 RepID=A0A2P5C5U1_PARAD|nr:hypothetical protein PanWU01x14_181920 [Parasponia andersonii]